MIDTRDVRIARARFVTRLSRRRLEGVIGERRSTVPTVSPLPAGRAVSTVSTLSSISGAAVLHANG